VQEGDPLYLIGTAQNDDWHGGGHLIMKKAGSQPFYISDGTEKDARGHLGMVTYLSMLGGPLLFAISAFLLATVYLEADAEGILAMLGAACLLMYAYAAIVNLLEMYNGMVLLRTQIEMARGNLQALYKRRHDLIPQLEAVVKEAAKYEKGLQGEVARIRSEAEAGQGRSFIALAENYPKLQANQNYLAFQQELSDTETWLAGGRSFLVDSITLYNTRVQTFPYSVFAKIGGFAPASMETG
jgi:LemA protein